MDPLIGRMPPASCHDCPLRPLNVFSSLAATSIDGVESARIGTRRLQHGQTIFLQGEPVIEAFTMFDGYAIRYRMFDSGERQVMQFVLPGDLMHFMDHGAPVWSSSAEVVHHAVLCVLAGPSLQRLFTQRLDFARAVAEINEAEEQMLEERVTDLRRDALDRVARLLLELFHRQRLRGQTDGNRCFLPFTQEHLGDAVGLTAVTVSRVHARLQRMQLMGITKRWLTVPDFDAAARRFDFKPGYIQERPLF